jgi:phosphatidylserine decarboxylase
MTKLTNIISTLFGKFAKYQFAPSLQRFINHSYVKLLGLDLSEFNPAHTYTSLNGLFTRELLCPRAIDMDTQAIISPADSFISACGFNENGLSYQIKGMRYSLDGLLEKCDQDMVSSLKDGDYINFYLSPKDYHRYHAPCDLQILKVVHIPGYLYPVNFPSLRNVKDLFIKNERVIFECKTSCGKNLYLVFVGALNVGSMVFVHEPRVQTNTKKSESSLYEHDALYVKKGDMLGYFEMGSTILMLCEKDLVALEEIENCKVRYGQKVARFL